MSWDEGIEGLVLESVASDASRLKVAGGAGSGKTLVLLRRVVKLLEEGTAPEEIVVFVSTPSAVDAFREGLEAIEAPGADKVKVTTVHDECIEILSDPAALAATGRVPRILTKAEEKFLMEDMKVLGIRPKRLREMLKFFFRQWTELGDADPSWLIVLEEVQVHTTIKNWLVAQKTMMEYELANITYNYLANNAEAAAKTARKNVFVDDYHNLTKASQAVSRLLATEGILVITGNENELVTGLEPYPYVDGFTNFADDCEGCEEKVLVKSIRCPQRLSSMANALATGDEMRGDRFVEIDPSAPVGHVQVAKWPKPDDEFVGIVKYLKARFEDEEDELHPQDVFIVVPNKTWGKNFVKQLDKRRMKATAIITDQALTGNPKDLGKSKAMRAYTCLNLVARPDDAVAWRMWCGYGDYLLQSGAWTRLQEWAAGEDIDVVDALERISGLNVPVFLESEKLAEAYRAGIALVDKCVGKTGFALVNALSEKGSEFPAETEALLEPIIGDEDAETLYVRAAQNLLDPKFDVEHGAIRVGTYESTQGLSAKLVILAGLIDGFMPCRDTFDISVLYSTQDKIRNTERKLFYSAITKSSSELILSYFQKETLDIAEPLKMEVRRIRAEHGERLAMLSPSIFIDEMGGSTPGAIAGERLR